MNRLSSYTEFPTTSEQAFKLYRISNNFVNRLHRITKYFVNRLSSYIEFPTTSEHAFKLYRIPNNFVNKLHRITRITTILCEQAFRLYRISNNLVNRLLIRLSRNKEFPTTPLPGFKARQNFLPLS